MNVRHVEGLKAIEEFGRRKLSGQAQKGNTPVGHSDPRIEKAAKTLADEYQDVPLIEDVFRAMASPTI